MGSIGRDEDYGRRLLPIVVEKAAKTNPDRVVYSFPITDNPADGFHDISNKRYANGVDRTAWWIESNFGKPAPRSFPSIGYIGPNDIRYPMLAIAAVKVGYKMAFLSPRNSIDGHLAVINACDCKLWALPSQKLGRVDQILEQRPMKVAPLPELLELLDEESVPVYLYHKDFTEARQDPFLVLHTSGSTGLPKPVIVPNGSLATPDAQHLLPPVEGRLTQTQFFLTPRRAYSTFPNFHSAGMVFCFALPFFYELSIVMGPPLVPVNLDLINSMLDHANVDGSFLAPSTLEEISKTPASLEKIAKTDFTFFGGGPLSQECGDRINAVTRVFNIVGVTEGSLFPIVQAEREDWNYLHFHPAGGFTYQQQSDDLWEQFQTRDPKLDLFQAFFQTFPDKDEVAIKDLYSKHPTKPGRWFYRGRTDDVIVLSNGEKINPLDMEACINNHAAVKASLVVGQGKFQTAALVQLNEPLPTTEEDLQTLKDSLWSSMETANLEAPAHGQLHEGYIIFATEDKPFLLAGKETILRAMTVKLYEKEIDEFYASRELQQASEVVPIDIANLESIREGVEQLVSTTLSGTKLAPNDDFFAGGLDSLSVFKVLASLRAALQPVAQVVEGSITASLVYSNPTIERLSKSLDRLVRSGSGTQEIDTTPELMGSLLDKYTSDLPDKPSNTGSTVILTGSTGSLGSYLLDALLEIRSIRRIFCLNRTADAHERQIRANITRGLKIDLPSDRVIFLHTDLSKPNLGLDSQSYEELLHETTHIIHNQWQVDFNLNLSSFEPHIRGIRHLVDFALQSAVNPAIFFVSSVGVVKNQKSNATVPEAPVTDFTVAEGGYGCSKLVSELILSQACLKSGIKCSIFRLGQVAGPVDTEAGMWNKHEWLPSIIASSKYLGMIPSTLSSLDRVDWLPVNYVSKIVMELAGLSENSECAGLNSSFSIFHGVNPCTTSWSTLLPAITSSLESEIAVVPWSTWLSALEASEEQGNLEQNPGIKLLDFYRNIDRAGASGLELPILETTMAKMKSETMKALDPVKDDWMRQWMKQWAF
ncbi:acetyl-CoA synthetase-like protein [Thozetella sp. PMI_491]|nr:acetyl-CoA synthetase-like protein [Thozetella sp. PMI_491]